MQEERDAFLKGEIDQQEKTIERLRSQLDARRAEATAAAEAAAAAAQAADKAEAAAGGEGGSAAKKRAVEAANEKYKQLTEQCAFCLYVGCAGMGTGHCMHTAAAQVLQDIC